MNYTARFPQAAKQLAMVTMLLAVLGTAGCMTRSEAVRSAPASTTVTSTPSAAPGECRDFGCEP